MLLTGKLRMAKETPYLKNDPSERMAVALGTLVGSAFMIENGHRDENGNIILPKIESEQTKGNATISMGLQIKMLGSRLEAEVELIARITEPIVYEERTIGTLSENICPDPQGNVSLQFSFRTGMALNGGGQQLGSEVQAIGHVSDDGKLATYHLHGKSSGARQPIKSAGDNWGTTNKYFEYAFDMSGSPASPNDLQVSSGITRVSSETDQKFVNQTVPLLATMNTIMAGLAFWVAEYQWTNGYCVEVQVPGMAAGSEKSVLINSETPFKAIVKHKFENTELTVPVIAKLTDGQVSVNPSGSKVLAPANFMYKAPDQKDLKATVNLETISNRGIAKLDVKFKTGEHGWKTINPGFCSTAPYSCNSPYGPWDFSCARPYQEGGTMSTSLYIPWSSDGKSRVTKTVRIFWPPAVTKASMTDITVYDITILKENESYFIIFKVIESRTIVCGEDGDCETIIKQPSGSAVKVEIVPANPGECG